MAPNANRPTSLLARCVGAIVFASTALSAGAASAAEGDSGDAKGAPGSLVEPATPSAEPAGAPKPSTPPLIGPRPDAPAAKPTAANEARGWQVEPGLDSADVALFMPRALLFVPRWTIFGITWPLEQLLTVVDRHAVIEHVEDFLYNDARTAGVLPIVSVSSFRGLTLGAKATHEDLGGHDEVGSISGQAGTQGDQAYELSFNADRAGGSRLWLETLSRFEIDPRARFAGIGHPPAGALGNGPRDRADETFFEHQRLMMLMRLGYTAGESSELVKLGGMARYASHDFRQGPEEDTSIGDVYDTSQLVGFAQGYELLELTADLVVDTRDVEGATNSGFYLEAFAGGVPPLSRELEFVHWGAEATGYLPLYRGFRPEDGRVLVLRAAIEAVEGEDADIPFSEMPRLGGSRLRGYAESQFRDRKAALATLEYHYPIHQFLAGSVYLDVGKVARDYGDFFSGSAPRFGGGFGLLVRSRDNLLLTIDVAYGDAPQVIITTDPLRAFAGRRSNL